MRGLSCFLALLTSVALFAAGCGRDDAAADTTERSLIVVPVQRRDLAITVVAKGTVETIGGVEIKSKASGKVLALPVETGDVVPAGALLAQMDTSEAATVLRRCRTERAVRGAELLVAERRRNRARELRAAGMISADELDEAELIAARAEAALVDAEAALDRAREQRAETVVRAPFAGTILAKRVAVGQIISSATAEVTGGGTTLLEMADLAIVQVRVQVREQDLGKIHPGLPATVKAEAYSDRRFSARILRREPVARIDGKNVSFPVLIRVANDEGLLLPGMSCEVEIEVMRRENVVAIASDAVVMPDDAPEIATLLGLPDGAPAPAEPGGAVVFIRDSAAIRPVAVRLGVQDWNLTEIAAGLDAGAEAIIPPSAQVARQFAEFREITRRWGSLPGRR